MLLTFNLSIVKLNFAYLVLDYLLLFVSVVVDLVVEHMWSSYFSPPLILHSQSQLQVKSPLLVKQTDWCYILG